MHLLFKMHADLTAHILFALKTTIPYRFCEVLIGRDLFTQRLKQNIVVVIFFCLLLLPYKKKTEERKGAHKKK